MRRCSALLSAKISCFCFRLLVTFPSQWLYPSKQSSEIDKYSARTQFVFRARYSRLHQLGKLKVDIWIDITVICYNFIITDSKIFICRVFIICNFFLSKIFSAWDQRLSVIVMMYFINIKSHFLPILLQSQFPIYHLVLQAIVALL